MVEAFYAAYNKRDLDTIAGLIADDIVYSDLVGWSSSPWSSSSPYVCVGGGGAAADRGMASA